MDNKKVEEIINRARHELTQAIVRSNVSRDLTMDDLEIILEAVEDSMRSLVVVVSNNIPSKTPEHSIVCKGNIVIGHHYVDKTKRHIMQVTDEHGTTRYYTDGDLEMVKKGEHEHEGGISMDAGQ